MADFAKIGPLGKGDFNLATAYKVLDVVYWQNGMYMAKMDTQGNLPSDTTYWMLCAQGVTVSNSAAITTQGTALDATEKNPAVPGSMAESIATLNEDYVSNTTAPLRLSVAGKPVIDENTDINTLVTPGSYRSGSGSVTVTYINAPFGGSPFNLHIEHVYNSNRIRQIAECYNNRRTATRNSVDNGATWTAWSDIVNSSGATFTGEVIVVASGNGTTPITIRSGNSTYSVIDYRNSDNSVMGLLGFSNTGNPVYIPPGFNAEYSLLHTYNSKKCAVVSALPASPDTGTIYFTSSGISYYVDGAWKTVQ